MTIIILQSWDNASGYGQWVYWASRQHTVNNKSGKNNKKVGQKKKKRKNNKRKKKKEKHISSQFTPFPKYL